MLVSLVAQREHKVNLSLFLCNVTYPVDAKKMVKDSSQCVLFTCCRSAAQLYLTLCNPMVCSTPGFSVLHCLLEFAQTHVHWVSDAIQPSHSLLSPSPAFNLSQHRVFSNELALPIRWPEYWSFSFSISPSNEYSGLTSFRIDWLDFLAAQGTLMSLLQHHSSKASVLHRSAFLIIQHSHP